MNNENNNVVNPQPVQPTAQPTAQPTVQPVVQSVVQPTVQPAVQPTVQPTVQPVVQPVVQPAVQPTVQPEPKKRNSSKKMLGIVVVLLLIALLVAAGIKFLPDLLNQIKEDNKELLTIKTTIENSSSFNTETQNVDITLDVVGDELLFEVGETEYLASTTCKYTLSDNKLTTKIDTTKAENVTCSVLTSIVFDAVAVTKGLEVDEFGTYLLLIGFETFDGIEIKTDVDDKYTEFTLDLNAEFNSEDIRDEMFGDMNADYEYQKEDYYTTEEELENILSLEAESANNITSHKEGISMMLMYDNSIITLYLFEDRYATDFTYNSLVNFVEALYPEEVDMFEQYFMHVTEAEYERYSMNNQELLEVDFMNLYSIDTTDKEVTVLQIDKTIN